MKTVISASRRTDIPAFYLKWFIDGICRGTLQISNPVYHNQSFTVDLSPENVEWIVFWSRNYGKLVKNLPIFESYKLFFHFTVLTHDPILEKLAISSNEAIRQAEILVKNFNPDHLIWRYDPIVIWKDQTSEQTNFSEPHFRELCCRFAELGVSKCYFSFATVYRKFRIRFQNKYPEYHLINSIKNLHEEILNRMKSAAEYYNIQLFSCCNDSLLDEVIQRGRCIDGSLLNQLSDVNSVSRAKNPSRPDCGCTRSIDIGDYAQQPCYFGCIYCYANPVWK